MREKGEGCVRDPGIVTFSSKFKHKNKNKKHPPQTYYTIFFFLTEGKTTTSIYFHLHFRLLTVFKRLPSQA